MKLFLQCKMSVDGWNRTNPSGLFKTLHPSPGSFPAHCTRLLPAGSLIMHFSSESSVRTHLQATWRVSKLQLPAIPRHQGPHHGCRVTHKPLRRWKDSWPSHIHTAGHSDSADLFRGSTNTPAALAVQDEASTYRHHPPLPHAPHGYHFLKAEGRSQRSLQTWINGMLNVLQLL